jgi:hypothetical protein
MKTSRVIAFLTLLFVAANNHNASACAACYNPAGSDKMTNAAAVGIGAMVVLMFFMLGAIFVAGWRLAWRAKHPLPDYNELLSEDQPPDNHDPKA